MALTDRHMVVLAAIAFRLEGMPPAELAGISFSTYFPYRAARA